MAVTSRVAGTVISAVVITESRMPPVANPVEKRAL